MSVEKATALGAFTIACIKLTHKHGGKQKLQKIVGKDIFYQTDYLKKWFFNNENINKLSSAELVKLTEKVNKLL